MEEGGWSRPSIITCNVMCLFLGFGFPCSLLVVGIMCLAGDFCGESPFPYWFLGFGILLILLAIIIYIVFVIVVIGDLIFIGRRRRRSLESG